MKKLFTVVIAALSLLVAACSPTPKSIAEKIQRGETLSEKEYTTALEYTIDLSRQITDSVDAHKGNFGAIVNALRILNAENPDANPILEALLRTDPSTLDEQNRKLYENLMKNVEALTNSIASEGPVFRKGEGNSIEPIKVEDGAEELKDQAELALDSVKSVDNNLNMEGASGVRQLNVAKDKATDETGKAAKKAE